MIKYEAEPGEVEELAASWKNPVMPPVIRERPKNTSGLEPAGRAVLVQTYEPEIKSSIIALPDQVKNRMDMVNQRATVVEVGETAWFDEPSPRARVGDKVLITRFAGFIAGADVTADGKTYRLVNDRDIFCRIVKEKE